MSLRRIRGKSFFLLVGIGLLVGFGRSIGQNASEGAWRSGLRVEGPFRSQNLAIYLVRGKQTNPHQYVTLDEAMRDHSVVIHERGNGGSQDARVNELEIENKSDRWLYIQAGDVIIGGYQDRTMGTDVAIPPHSSPQPISAFCVEHGRWTAGAGGAAAFEHNPAIVGSSALKRSIQGEKNQSRVWAEVAREEVQAREIVTVTGESSAPALSATGTYDAIVGNPKIRADRADYVNPLLPRLEKADDAIGLVVAINGDITAADIYGSSALFHKLARKLMESYALEAVLARNSEKSGTPPPSREAALTFLTDVLRAAATDEKVADSIHRRTRETGKTVMYEYVESGEGRMGSGKLLHSNVVKK